MEHRVVVKQPSFLILPDDNPPGVDLELEIVDRFVEEKGFENLKSEEIEKLRKRLTSPGGEFLSDLDLQNLLK